MIYKLSESFHIILQRLLGQQAHSKCGLLLSMNKTYNKTKKFHGLSSALNYWLLTNQENCGISVELPLRAYITLTFGKSTMCFVEGKTSCVCADMFVD